MPVLLTALVAVTGLEVLAGLESQSAPIVSMVVGAALIAVVAVAALGMLARAVARRRPVRARVARAAWLAATATATPTHTDVRALMRARPPSATP